MSENPIVEDVHRIREKLAAEFEFAGIHVLRTSAPANVGELDL